MMQKIIVLGSTGSVGKSSLEVIEQNKNYVAKCLVASKNSNLINQQSKIHKKAKIYLENPKKTNLLSKPLIDKDKLYDIIFNRHVEQNWKNILYCIRCSSTANKSITSKIKKIIFIKQFF